jgi:hypothetical protein
MGPRAGLDVEKKIFFTLLGLELRPLDRPARSHSLYRLSYPGTVFGKHKIQILVGRLDFLADGFCYFTQSLIFLGHGRFLPRPFEFVSH